MKASFSIVLAAVVFLLPVPSSAQCDRIPGCALVWSDEFNGSAVDPANWEFQTGDGSQFGIPGWGNNELQWYQSSNATVANGALTIQARQQAVGGKAYTSARLRSLGKADFLYGRFEMRARLPVGKGMWPAFWMLPTDPFVYGVWAASGEIDIMESIGGDTIHGTIHYGGTFPENVYSGSVTSLPTGSADEFHVYAVEWEPTEIRWYVDGQLYGTKTSWYSTAGAYPAPFDVDFHLLLNLAVGGNFPGNPDGTTVFPQEYVVDYVRVYQQAPPDPERAAQCESTRTRAAGKYAKCTTSVAAKAIRKTTSQDAARLSKCAAKLAATFAKAELKAAGSCSSGGDAAAVQAAIDACVADAVTDLGGVPGPGEPFARCQSGKVAEAGKHLDCRFRTTSVAVRKAVVPDFGRCAQKIGGKWPKLEGNPGRPCSTTADLAARQADVEECHVQVAGSLGAPDCGNGTVEADEECDDGNTSSGDGCSATCQLQPEYGQDFETLPLASGSALADDGWRIFGNVFDGVSGNYLYGYGPFAAPNGGQAFSAIVDGQGGPGQGSQQLSVYSDYNNGDHANGHRIEALVFRERLLGAADVGKTLTFSFAAKRGNLGGATTAQAFLKTLDPDAGFVTTSFAAQDTTAIPESWADYSVTLDIEAGMEGLLLQYGFSSRATNYDGSGVLYDNLMLLAVPTVP